MDILGIQVAGKEFACVMYTQSSSVLRCSITITLHIDLLRWADKKHSKFQTFWFQIKISVVWLAFAVLTGTLYCKKC